MPKLVPLLKCLCGPRGVMARSLPLTLAQLQGWLMQIYPFLSTEEGTLIECRSSFPQLLQFQCFFNTCLYIYVYINKQYGHVFLMHLQFCFPTPRITSQRLPQLQARKAKSRSTFQKASHAHLFLLRGVWRRWIDRW